MWSIHPITQPCSLQPWRVCSNVLFSLLHVHLQRPRHFLGIFFQKSSSTYLTLCLITPHSKFAPLRSNDRRTGSVAVHAMLGAKWSALANRWGQCPTTQHCPLFFVEAKECSLMNVGPNPPKCSTRSCRMFIVPWDCTCVVQCAEYLYLPTVQVSKEEKPSTGVLSPPLAQEILSLNAKISKPPVCIITGCETVQDHTRPMPIYTSFSQWLGRRVYSVPLYPSLALSQQVPVLEDHKPWFLERVSSWALSKPFSSHRRWEIAFFF